ncbi:UNVERIFIED_CONTAM: hypothetical protein FKN15_001206 [Acipenser sinensis]
MGDTVEEVHGPEVADTEPEDGELIQAGGHFPWEGRGHMLMGDCPGCDTEDRDFVELGRRCLPAPGDSSGD